MKNKTRSVEFSSDTDTNGVKNRIVDADLQYAIRFVHSNCYDDAAAPEASPGGEGSKNYKNFIITETNYVGLVNQAMTCYLNSLLQALFMTPEFRNALYNWEYIEGSEKDEASSIPYQLQKLFLNLQTSTKSAVETTSLTKSFGWDSTEAWQQHDIQELCRVMFDALEQKFKNTEQADLINRLYEGKMIDYVKCLECGTEKSREDTFLDIPLPVRPFGSNVAYNSVEEAMRAFVQYETLEGNNQYHCEKCDKKCNAHKGLKFKKFPYLLTLHLKRFDFDYNTFHRIKLNDKVTFPDILNLNSFIETAVSQDSAAGEEETGLGIKCDDSSTTDSGTLDDECPPCDNSLSNSNHSANHDQDDDEGIDISNGPSTSNCTHNHENDKNRARKGPYIYELFSIMIHSGSASGGHYYAYIKDFRTGEWLCFNDQSVTQITHDDIQKTFGGGPPRAYYSGAYSSSTNAYMLMYRQIDRERNALPMQAQDFPQHIQELLKKMKESEDNDRKNREKQILLPRLRVYCHHPTENVLFDVKLYLTSDTTWAEATESVYKKLCLRSIVSLDQCRLVSYDHASDVIECSYEGREQDTVANILDRRFDLLLEIREKDKKFETYLPGGVAPKVFVVDVPKKQVVDGLTNVRGLLSQTVKEYKQMIGKIVNIDPKKMKMVLRKFPADTKLLANDESILQTEGFCNTSKVFVSTMLDTDSTISFNDSVLCKIAESLDNIIALHIQLPVPREEMMKLLDDIPVVEELYKEKGKFVTNDLQNSNAVEPPVETDSKAKESLTSDKSNDGTPLRNTSPLLPADTDVWLWSEQFNSEDNNSLSSTKKAALGDQPKGDDCHIHKADLYFRLNNGGKVDADSKTKDVLTENKSNDGTPLRNTSPLLPTDSDGWFTCKQSNSEDSSLSDTEKTIVGDPPKGDDYYTFVDDMNFKMKNQVEVEYWGNDDDSEYYFKATPYKELNKNLLRVLVDTRMRLSTLKKYLETYVGVPVDYFKIYRQSNDSGETECSCLSDQLSSYDDGDRFIVKPGRALRNGEFKVKIYQLLLDSNEPYKFLCEWIVSKDMTVGQAKKEILAEIERKYDIVIPYERCRLRKKSYKTASKVLLDDQKFEDIRSYSHCEMIVQELPDKEPVTDVNQVVLFVRRWSPSKMQLGPFQEIVMDGRSMEELEKKLSLISDIPEEFIEVAKCRGTFPCDISVLRVQDDHEWNEQVTTIDGFTFSLEDGSVLLYRDSREKAKQLSCDEVKEIFNKESSRLMPFSYTLSYSPRRERALKIHLDTK